jgi:hypothetical protein
MSDVLTDLADAIDTHAEIVGRPGQREDLERIATQLRAERGRIHSWAGLMTLLNEHYPEDVFVGDGRSGDPGPVIVALLRENDRLRRIMAR